MLFRRLSRLSTARSDHTSGSLHLAPGGLGGLFWEKVLLIILVIIHDILSIDVIYVPVLPPPAASLCSRACRPHHLMPLQLQMV